MGMTMAEKTLARTSGRERLRRGATLRSVAYAPEMLRIVEKGGLLERLGERPGRTAGAPDS